MGPMERALRALDPWLYRHPFEGASARRYARLERCGFGELDQRLIAAWDGELAAAARLVDVGCGPATFAVEVARRHPHLEVIGVEPSRDFTRTPRPGVTLRRGWAEALPLESASVDVAVCLSSIRHVRDRGVALRELRRVVRPGGVAYVVELDPTAGTERARAHARRLGSRVLGLAFGPLVLATAPPAETISATARAAGWRDIDRSCDPEQPVYILRLA
jgi:ubiquinone/menaquinone biosynthesis C-methylase UbiE